LRQREVAENSEFNKSVGDSQGFCGVNPEFSATAKPGGIFFEISSFEKAHGLKLQERSFFTRVHIKISFHDQSLTIEFCIPGGV
jgi:hypothetical protein